MATIALHQPVSKDMVEGIGSPTSASQIWKRRSSCNSLDRNGLCASRGGLSGGTLYPAGE